MSSSELQRGTLVRATKVIDPEGAHVEIGTLGVCFEQRNYYGDGAGPMIRWVTGAACNVYASDVEEVE